MPSDLVDVDPILLPSPRHLERHDGWVTVPEQRTVSGLSRPQPGWVMAADGRAWVTCQRTSLMVAEGYTLHLGTTGIRIIAGGDGGARCALATIAQLIAQYGSRLPCLTIHDAPVFAVRGVMLDVSRDRIPTMAEFQRIIPQLASWKINHLQLYVEHTVAYAGYDEAWHDTSALTVDELRTIDRWCGDHGIELAANQNCFGHLAGFLQHPRWHHLAEIPPGASWDFGGHCTRTGPFSLCPSEPKALEFVADLLGQLAPAIGSPLINIGCDETYDVGQGRSRTAVEQRGRSAVYLDFVKSVCAITERLGKRPQFWADIALEHPECLLELPKDLIGLAWGYEADARFADWCDTITGSGHQAWVCPGTSSWRSFTGRTTERRANLFAAAKQGHAHGATGMLITDWGDLGHRQQWPISLRGLAEGAHRAWAGTRNEDPRATSLHAFGDRSLEVADWLDALGDADLDLRRIGGKHGGPLRNQTALFNDLHRPIGESWIGEASDWHAVSERIASLKQHMPTSVDHLIHDELAHTGRQALLGSRRAAARRAKDRTSLNQLLPELHDLLAEHRDLWLKRSRPGGLDRSCSHYERLASELSGHAQASRDQAGAAS